MWSFKSTPIKKLSLSESEIMSVRQGLESRFSDRFVKFAGTSADFLQSSDNARKVAEELKTSSGVIDAQEENINELFTVAEILVKTVDDFQRQSGKRQVNNIPLPGDSIRSSYGKKLGYVKLCMKFMNAGLLHFMEDSLSLEEELKTRESIIKSIAQETRSVHVLGRLQDVDLDDLSSSDPIVDTRDETLIDDFEDSHDNSDVTHDSGISVASAILKNNSKVEQKVKSLKSKASKK